MKKIFIPFVALAALASASSCQSMLDIPQKGVVAYEDFYQSDEDALAALVSMYANFLQNVAGTEGIDNPEQVILNYSADDILSAGGDRDDHAPFRFFDEFRYDVTNGTLKQMYQRYYYAIYHANLVISNFTTENRTGAEPKWKSKVVDQYVAEARVMRAYVHMMLALTWNCPPILDRIYEGDELPVNSESQEQVLSWVVSECEKAIASGVLPDRNGPTDKDNTTRMNVGFARFVAGKAAMFMNDPATARKYLGDLINSGDYALVPSEDFWTNFHIAGDGSSEKIFEPNFLEDPAFTNNAWGSGAPIQRGRWMVANVFCWRTDHLASEPRVHAGFQGWNGGAIQEDFAKKFLEHDGNSPRRLACFLTGEEWLYEMEWNSPLNDASLEAKKTDPARGINNTDGIFSHGTYFEWKHMVYINPPKILTGGKSYPSDNVSGLGAASNQKNFNVARYAEALLLYAEACIGSSDEAKGLAALNAVQERSGSGKISDKLTWEAVAEEKQYEMWFESCRFHDLVRWSKQGKVNLDQVFNKAYDKTKVPVCHDEFWIEGKPGYQKEHKLYTEYAPVTYVPFQVGKHEYLPFPFDFQVANPNLHNVLGWASAD